MSIGRGSAAIAARATARTSVRIVLATIPLALAPAHARADGGPAAVVKMTDDDAFEPRTVEVHVGDTVLWRNISKTSHSVTADPKLAKDPKHVELPAGATPFDSGKLKAGATFRYTFTTAGKYTYVCVPHEKEGMIGHVVVKKSE